MSREKLHERQDFPLQPESYARNAHISNKVFTTMFP